ncbi:MAG: glycosyltransferase, partial [Pseudomonadota bacterium]
MQKVLIISPHPQTHGGVVNFIETLKAGLLAYEINSFFVGSRNNLSESAFATTKRILGNICELNRLAQQQKFDLIHINPSFNLKSLLRDGLLLLTLQRLGYKNIVVYFHGWQSGLADRIAGNFLYRKIFLRVFASVACIIVLAPEFKQQLEQIGIASDKILLGKTMFAQSLTIPIPQNTRQNILFMSRFDKAKGIYELLQAFALIADKFPELDLIFAGDGKEKANLQKQAGALNLGERIKFPG